MPHNIHLKGRRIASLDFPGFSSEQVRRELIRLGFSENIIVAKYGMVTK